MVVRTQNQDRIRITCLLTICADGDKLPSYIIFKGKNINNRIMNNIKNNIYIKNKNIFINFNSNPWSTKEIMIDWIKNLFSLY